MLRGQFSIFGAVEENGGREFHGFSPTVVQVLGVAEAHGNSVFHFGKKGMGEIGAKGRGNIHRRRTGNAETTETVPRRARGLMLPSELGRGNYRIYPSAVGGGKF